MNEKRSLSEDNHYIFSTAYSPAGDYIATTGSDNNIIVWNAATGIIHRTYTGLKKRPNQVVFSRDGKTIYSAGEDGLITTWDATLVQISSQTGGQSGAIKALAINKEGTLLVSGGEDRVVRVWDLAGGKPELKFELQGHKKTVYTLDFSPDGRHVISGGADKMLILWDMETGSMVREVQGHEGYVRCARFSPDGKQIGSGGDDKLIRIRDAGSLDEMRVLEGHTGWVQTVAYSPSSRRIISGSHDGTIRIWDADSGKQLAVSAKMGNVVLSVDVCPSANDFISACLLSDKLRIWAYEPAVPVDAGSAAESMAEHSDIERANPGDSENETVPAVGQSVIPQTPANESTGPETPRITIFSPMAENGPVNHTKNTILVVGKAEAADGIQSVLLNRQRASLNSAGVFELEVPLAYGDNPIEIVAVSRTGKMGKSGLTVHCTNESAVLPDEGPSMEQGRYYALIIGIDQYDDERIEDLDFPIRDAGNLYETLLEGYSFAPEDIQFLKNPTRTELIIALDELSQKVTARDNLLIFYAGHGYWDEKTGIGYWLPRDAARSNTANWFNNSTLRDFIGGIRSKHTLLIADACFSGSIFKTRGGFSPVDQGITKLYQLPSRKAMTSGALKEVPDESVFVKYLIRELKENQEKYLPSEILYGNFRTMVLNNSPNVPQYGTIQNVGDEGGDFIFVRK